MSKFQDFTLTIPNFWEREWQEAIDEAEGAAKQILVYQQAAANLLKGIDDIEATPERVAWLTIWTRVSIIFEGILAALGRNSATVIEVLYRMSFECMLQVEVILEPISMFWDKRNAGPKIVVSASFEDKAWSQVRKRLQAYTAWCLWNDCQYYAELLNDRTLSGVWNPAAALQFLAAKEQMPGFEKIFSPRKVETDRGRLREGRLMMEATLRSRLKRCDDWLADSGLVEWKQKLDDLQKARVTPLTFFRLVKTQTGNISQRLKEVERRWSYVLHMSGSMILHGSTIEKTLRIGNDTIFPYFVDTAESCDRLALDVGSSCNTVTVFLAILKRILWSS